MTRHMFHSNTVTTAESKTTNATWCIWELKTNLPKQTNPVHSVLSLLTVRCQPTTSTPSSTVPYMTVPISLSLSALQCLNCQAKPNYLKLQFQGHQCIRRPGPLFLHTTEPQVLNYHVLSSYYMNFSLYSCGNPTLSMNQGPCQSTVWPSRFPS